jgi:hypothetical protein
MSGVITIDAAELNVAAPRVEELHLRLVDSARALVGLDFAVEMPPGVRGRVVGLVDAARADVVSAAEQINGMGEEIARRAGLAKLADRLGTISLAALPLGAQLDAIAAYHRNVAKRAAVRGNLASARHNRGYQLKTEKLSRRLGAVGKLVGFGPATVAVVRNPYISTDRKIGKIAADGGSDVALGAIAKVGLSRLPFAAAGPAGIAASIAWMLVDSKLHITDELADGATWTVDKAGDGAQWLDDHALDPAGDAISEGVDKVTPWDGLKPW